MRSERRAGLALVVPALAVLSLFLLWPVVRAIATSLTVDTPFAPPRSVGLANYAELVRDRTARGTIGWTLMFVGISTALEVGLGILLALVLHATVRGRGLVRAAVLVPWALPTVVAAVLWRYLFNDQYGLVNLLLHGGDVGAYRAWLADTWSARAAIVAADVWKTTSFAGLIVLAGLQSIPTEVLEAARVDGARPWRRFVSVTLPLLRPAILLAVLFRTMDAFRVFDLVYVMTGGAPGATTDVLQFYGYRKMFPEQRFGYGSAVAVVLFLIVGLVSLVYVRLLLGRRVEGRA